MKELIVFGIVMLIAIALYPVLLHPWGLVGIMIVASILKLTMK